MYIRHNMQYLIFIASYSMKKDGLQMVLDSGFTTIQQDLKDSPYTLGQLRNALVNI